MPASLEDTQFSRGCSTLLVSKQMSGALAKFRCRPWIRWEARMVVASTHTYLEH